MNIIEKIYLDMLNTDSVAIVKKKYIIIDNVENQVGIETRNTYMNTQSERKYLQSILPESYYTAIISVWGDFPTITESI